MLSRAPRPSPSGPPARRRCPRRATPADRRRRSFFPATRDRSPLGRPQPRDRLGKLALPVSCDPRDRHDLAGAHDERDPSYRGLAAAPGDPELVDLERRLARAPAARSRTGSASSRPTISAASERGVASAIATVPQPSGPSEHGDPIGHGLDLVQLVRDEDHRPPVGNHLPQRREQHLRLLRREHGGRLVEDQDPRVAVESLQDLDPLLLAQRELPDARLRVDIHARSGRRARRPWPRSGPGRSGTSERRPGGARRAPCSRRP